MSRNIHTVIQLYATAALLMGGEANRQPNRQPNGQTYDSRSKHLNAILLAEREEFLY